MMINRVWAAGSWVILIGCLTFATWPVEATTLPVQRRVNVPFFNGAIQYDKTAILWLGRVTSSENYADIRVGYNATELYVNAAIFDRRLWYDPSPTADTLTNWDSVTLYVNRTGNVGSTPGVQSYRFDGQIYWWGDRAPWQAAYQGSSGQWASASLPFTTTTSFKWETPTVGGLNNNQNNRGWIITYRLPFTSLGLSGPPAPGTIWGLGIAVHDRDTESEQMSPDMVWPESLLPNSPATWGQLHFGTPTYTPSPSVPRGSVVVRNKLNGAVVTDGAVGGGTVCGGSTAPDYFSQWGALNYAHVTYFNVQNQGDISDWPCFSKYFVTFPLDAVPAGKTVISATLTLYQFGNAGQGWDPGPQPSYLQVLSVDRAWDENTLTWNTAPLARENLTGAWVDPLPAYPGYPGVPRSWDVSQAVADAYAAGEPARLAVYSADGAIQSGRYFYASDIEDLNAAGRPTLTIIWGDSPSTLQQSVWPSTAMSQQTITYTLAMLGSGRALTLTDDLPVNLSAPLALQVQGGGVANFDQGARRLTWSGTPGAGQPITITLPVKVLATGPKAIINRAVLTDALPSTTMATTILLANPRQVWLPLARK